jgi:hypothetical protein
MYENGFYVLPELRPQGIKKHKNHLRFFHRENIRTVQNANPKIKLFHQNH